MKVIDTRRNSRAGGVSHGVSERKYVCEPCATELGQAVGQVSAEDHRAIVAPFYSSIKQANDRVAELESQAAEKVRVVNADEIVDVISETIRTELAKTVKKTAPRAAAKPSAS